MAQPRDAQVTVVGGGAVGAAVAYFMARAGWRDVQLLEKGDLCSATSSQAAGMVGQARPTADRTRLAMAAAAVYRDFDRTTGYAADFVESGAVRIALSAESARELRQIADVAETVGLPVEFLSPHRLGEVFPALEDTRGVHSALWSPTCGYLQPNSLVDAYVRAARELGVTVATHTPVLGIGVGDDGAVDSVSVPDGSLRTELVVLAAGPWTAALTRSVGLELPIVPVLHEYFVTEPLAGWRSDLPCLRVPEIQVYARGEGGRLLCGGFEREATSLDPREVTTDAVLRPAPSWDVLGGFARSFAALVPSVESVGVSATFQGWPSFTPDGRFVVGPVSSLRGLALAAGCNAHGVSGSAGLAMHLVESLQPDPSPYVQSLSPDRFVPMTWTWQDARAAAQVVYESYYPIPPAVAAPTP